MTQEEKIKEILKILRIKGGKIACPECGRAMYNNIDSEGEAFYDCLCGNTEDDKRNLRMLNITDTQKSKLILKWHTTELNRGMEEVARKAWRLGKFGTPHGSNETLDKHMEEDLKSLLNNTKESK